MVMTKPNIIRIIYVGGLPVGGVTQASHKGGHGSIVSRVRHLCSLQGQQVVAEGLPIAQSGTFPFPFGRPQPCSQAGKTSGKYGMWVIHAKTQSGRNWL